MAGLAELDENHIKIMIIKLQQIEKLLKDVGSRKKRKAKALNRATLGKTAGRRPSNASTIQGFQLNQMTRAGQRITTIEEDVNSDNSEEGLIKKKSANLNKTGGNSG